MKSDSSAFYIISYRYFIKYCELIDWFTCTRLMVSANKVAMLKIVAFLHSFENGMLSVKIISDNADSSTLLDAGSLIIA